MTLLISKVVVIHDDLFEVTFADVDGSCRVVSCQFNEDDGIQYVNFAPDPFARGEAYEKDVIAVVKAIHDARTRGRDVGRAKEQPPNQ